MLVSVGILAILTFLGHISPWSLLAFTFLLNIGSAMNNPAWQAIVPELVPRELIPDTVSLNSASNNLARAVGPALGGLMVAAFARAHTGAGSVFVLNSLSFAGVIWVLVNWKRIPLFKSALPSERIAGSIRSGLRYVRHAPDLQRLAHPRLHLHLLRLRHLGAPRRSRQTRSHTREPSATASSTAPSASEPSSPPPSSPASAAASPPTASSPPPPSIRPSRMLVLAFVRSPAIVIVTLVFAGFAWTSTMATLNTSVQLSVPAWVQARALGTYLMTFQGGMAFGSILWGFIAEHSSTPSALAVCRLPASSSPSPSSTASKSSRAPQPDHTPYQWKRPAPELTPPPATKTPTSPTAPSASPSNTSSPPTATPSSPAPSTSSRDVRLRDGAIRWGIFRDATDPTHLNETFVMESWLDYLRSRERVTLADREIQDDVRALHHDPTTPPGAEPLPPKVTYQIYAREVTDPSIRSRNPS